MKHLSLLLLLTLAPLALLAAPAPETAYFPNVVVYTNLNVRSAVFTNGFTSTGPGTFTGGTVTNSSPLLNLSQTWNNSGVTFSGAKINVTDTASGSSSLLMDLQVGGVSMFSVRKDGGMRGNAGVINTLDDVIGNGVLRNGYAGFFNSAGAGFGVGIAGTGTLGWSSDSASYSAKDTILLRDAANTLALRNGTNAQTFSVYGSYTDAANYRRLKIVGSSAGAFLIGTDGAGTGIGNYLIFITDNTQRWQISATGHLTTMSDNTYDIGANGANRPRIVYAGTALVSAANIQAGTSSFYEFAAKSRIWSPSNGLLELTDSAGSNFDRLQFGGTTASFPALKRNGTDLAVRVADDTADASITVKGVGYPFTIGNTNVVDMSIACSTNNLSQNTSFAYATNAVEGVEMTHVHWILNASGSNKTFAIPTGWKTNFVSAVPPALTNATWTKMTCRSLGNTSTAANQTNVFVTFEYYK